jgi:hypothetical protein
VGCKTRVYKILRPEQLTRTYLKNNFHGVSDDHAAAG